MYVKNEIIFFVIVQLSFLLGYLMGKSRVYTTRQDANEEKSSINPFKVTSTPKKMMEVKIDEARFVTKVKDDAFVKNDNELGKSTSVDDDIGLSVSKLAQLKKSK
jgi:hypothetical protein